MFNAWKLESKILTESSGCFLGGGVWYERDGILTDMAHLPNDTPFLFYSDKQNQINLTKKIETN